MREVIWTNVAQRDLQAAFEAADDRNPAAAEDFLSIVDAAIEMLKQFPEMARSSLGLFAAWF
jgi:plasmid stabilization system protein ParE